MIREIEGYRRELGLTHLIGRFQWPGLPQALALRSLRLLGAEVIPHFRRPAA